jgi:hypothetical protein
MLSFGSNAVVTPASAFLKCRLSTVVRSVQCQALAATLSVGYPAVIGKTGWLPLLRLWFEDLASSSSSGCQHGLGLQTVPFQPSRLGWGAAGERNILWNRTV